MASTTPPDSSRQHTSSVAGWDRNFTLTEEEREYLVRSFSELDDTPTSTWELRNLLMSCNIQCEHNTVAALHDFSSKLFTCHNFLSVCTAIKRGHAVAASASTGNFAGWAPENNVEGTNAFNAMSNDKEFVAVSDVQKTLTEFSIPSPKTLRNLDPTDQVDAAHFNAIVEGHDLTQSFGTVHHHHHQRPSIDRQANVSTTPAGTSDFEFSMNEPQEPKDDAQTLANKAFYNRAHSTMGSAVALSVRINKIENKRRIAKSMMKGAKRDELKWENNKKVEELRFHQHEYSEFRITPSLRKAPPKLPLFLRHSDRMYTDKQLQKEMMEEKLAKKRRQPRWVRRLSSMTPAMERRMNSSLTLSQHRYMKASLNSPPKATHPQPLQNDSVAEGMSDGGRSPTPGNTAMPPALSETDLTRTSSALSGNITTSPTNSRSPTRVSFVEQSGPLVAPLRGVASPQRPRTAPTQLEMSPGKRCLSPPSGALSPTHKKADDQEEYTVAASVSNPTAISSIMTMRTAQYLFQPPLTVSGPVHRASTPEAVAQSAQKSATLREKLMAHLEEGKQFVPQSAVRYGFRRRPIPGMPAPRSVITPDADRGVGTREGQRVSVMSDRIKVKRYKPPVPDLHFWDPAAHRRKL